MTVTNAIDEDLQKMMFRAGVRGMIPVVQASGHDLSQRELRMVPWREAARIPKPGKREEDWNARVMSEVPVPKDMVRRMTESLPPIVRRTARERYKVLLDRLIADGLKTYKAYGYPVWPKSIQDDLKTLGWREGDPNFYGQVESLARKYIEEGARKQKAKDQQKSALDWHGHLSA